MDLWISVWSRLTEHERRDAIHLHLLALEQVPGARDSAIAFLARDQRTTPATVARWNLERRADRMARSAALQPEQLAQFLATWHIRRRGPMLARFLDVAGIPNLNGVIDVRTATEPVAVEALEAAVRAIQAEFPAGAVALYLDALEAQARPPMKHLPEARRRVRAGLGIGPLPSGPGTPVASALPLKVARDVGPFEPRSHPIDGEMPDPVQSDAEALTPLDHLVEGAARAAEAGIVGALSFSQLRELVAELMRLNAERHRTCYHLGVLDVLEGREPDPAFARAGERERGWYLCGALIALGRRGDLAASAALFDRHTADARRLLGDRHEACGQAALPLVEGLLAAGRAHDALRALVPTAVGRGGAPLMERLLGEAERLLAEGRATEAMPALALVLDGVETLRRRFVPVPEALAARARLLRGLALRLHGSFDAGRELLEPLTTHEDPGLAAAAQAHLGLADARVRSLTEVRLPKTAADLAATAAVLGAGEARFERAWAAAGPGGLLADVCLGTLHLARGQGARALPHLERAVAGTRHERALAEGHGVVPRLRLYLALALAESLDPARASEALDLLVEAVTAAPDEGHAYLLARALSALAAQGDERGAEAVVRLYDVLGDRLLGAALEAGLLPGHGPLRETLAQRAEDHHRSRHQRGSDAEALLRDALLAGDVARAERALSVLEDLSDDAQGRARLLAVVTDPRRFDPAWGPEEARTAHVRLLEAEGRYREAALLLCAWGHEALSRDTESGLFAVDDLLDRVGSYGIECPDPALVARTAALRSAQHGATLAVAPPGAEAKGRVFIIGGNEVQARYEDWLRAETLRRWPGVELTFDFSGWSSNWGRELDATGRRVAEAGAVVIMRFIRTLLGRSVRVLCGTYRRPWVACTGHGRQSMLAAIEQAVRRLGASGA